MCVCVCVCKKDLGAEGDVAVFGAFLQPLPLVELLPFLLGPDLRTA